MGAGINTPGLVHFPRAHRPRGGRSNWLVSNCSEEQIDFPPAVSATAVLTQPQAAHCAILPPRQHWGKVGVRGLAQRRDPVSVSQGVHTDRQTRTQAHLGRGSCQEASQPSVLPAALIKGKFLTRSCGKRQSIPSIQTGLHTQSLSHSGVFTHRHTLSCPRAFAHAKNVHSFPFPHSPLAMDYIFVSAGLRWQVPTWTAFPGKGLWSLLHSTPWA